MRRILPLLPAVVLALSAPSGRADNPRLSLELDEVTFAEAAQALSRASGQRVALAVRSLPPEVPQPPPPPVLLEKARFNWRNVSFADALRQLCRRYKLIPNHSSAGYELHPSDAGPRPLPAKLVGLVEKEGVRLFVRGISLYESSQRRVGFLDGVRDEKGQGGLGVSFACLFPNRDAEEIAGIENLVARDELGNALSCDPTDDGYYGGDHFLFGVFPDEWSRSYRFSLPDPRAKKLQSLEGDFIVYSRTGEHRLEIPLPLREEVERRQLGSVTFVLSGYHVVPKQRPEAEDLPRPAGITRWRHPAGPSLRVQVTRPSALQVRGRNGRGMLPSAIGASGKSYSPVTVSGRGSGGGGISTMDSTIVFSGMDEPPVKLVWDLVERSQPRKLFSFRMTDIPLPSPGRPVPPVPRRTAPIEPPVVAAARQHPFHQKGGGTLLTRVLLPQGPVGGGTLQLGLARKEGAGWTGVRWREVSVDPHGIARVKDLKPGAYRVQRIYRPQEVPAAAPAGRWLDGEVQITIAAGKEAQLPPLRWVPEGEMKPPVAPVKQPARR